MRRTILMLAAVMAAVPALAGGFSGDRAMHWLEWQCSLGPRVPGTEAHATFRAGVAALADSLGLRHREDRFRAVTPLDGQEHDLANIVISAGPDGGPRIWFAAHWDCRAFADQDPDPARRRDPVMGANDGASGVAVLLHLAEILAADPPAIGVDLLLFDAEDQGLSGQPRTYCIGSERMAAGWGGFTSPLPPERPLGLILLDMVGERGVEIPMEGTSLRYAPGWTRRIFDRAAELGLDVFRARPGRAAHDDHVPFLRLGIPALDLIDFDYPEWHTVSDVPEACDPRGLEQSGTLLLDLVRRPPD